MQVELNNMYANLGVNNNSEKLRTKQKTWFVLELGAV
jgi:hypothetical protein